MTSWVARQLKKHLKENLLLVLISLLVANAAPGPALAQGAPLDPAPFAVPLSLSRGELSPVRPGAYSLGPEAMCAVVTGDWGWPSCEGVEAMVAMFTPALDTLVVEEPNSDGHVRFDDWRSADRDDAIREIEGQLVASTVEQARRTGQQIFFEGWRVPPTLDEAKGVLFYAYDLNWDGVTVVNVAAIAFDRQGYVRFLLVPTSSEITETKTVAMIDEVLRHYRPWADQSYAAFVAGDRVAAAGAVGVLAASLGVRYGKGAAAGALAVALLVLKKAWILVLLPFLWVGKLIRGRKR